MKKYTTLFFDLDNTLLDFDKSENGAIKRVLNMHNLPSNDEVAATYSAINKTFWEAFERGDIEKNAIFTGRFHKLLETLQRTADAEKMAQDYFYSLAEGHDVIDGAVEILHWLRDAGYCIYVTTNGVALTQYKRIEDAKLEALFDGVFVSEHAGFQKPEKAYFDYVITNGKEKDTSRILVIGDSQSSDILGGINAGLDTCWYNPKGITGKYQPTYEISALDQLKKIL